MLLSLPTQEGEAVQPRAEKQRSRAPTRHIRHMCANSEHQRPNRSQHTSQIAVALRKHARLPATQVTQLHRVIQALGPTPLTVLAHWVLGGQPPRSEAAGRLLRVLSWTHTLPLACLPAYHTTCMLTGWQASSGGPEILDYDGTLWKRK